MSEAGAAHALIPDVQYGKKIERRDCPTGSSIQLASSSLRCGVEAMSRSLDANSRKILPLARRSQMSLTQCMVAGDGDSSVGMSKKAPMASDAGSAVNVGAILFEVVGREERCKHFSIRG